MNANEIMRRAWRELPPGDRGLLEAISADRWEVCGRGLGTYTDELLRSAGCGSLSSAEIAWANAAVALWVPELRVVLINESHPAFDGLDSPSFAYDLSRVAWHEWGHALSVDRARQDDIAAGDRYLGLLPEALASFVRQAGYGRRDYTHEVVAEVYSMLMARRRLGQTGRPPWLHAEVYEFVRRVVGWTQWICRPGICCPREKPWLTFGGSTLSCWPARASTLGGWSLELTTSMTTRLTSSPAR